MTNLEDYYVCLNDTDTSDCFLCEIKGNSPCKFRICPLKIGYFFAKRDNG